MAKAKSTKAKSTAAKKTAAAKRTVKKVTKPKPSSSGCEGVWKGVIARLRIYDQPKTTGKKVFAYLSPGNNDDYIGATEDKNMIEALFHARNNGNAIQGYTNDKCKIEWIDY